MLPASRSGFLPKGNRLFHDAAFDSLLITLKRAGNLVLIEVIIDGVHGNLIFDSGSSAELVLNKTYFRNHARCGNRKITGINGLVKEIDIIKVDSLVMSDITSHKIEADLLDLSHIENSKGVKILGFFGLKFLQDFEIVLDVMKGELQIFRTNWRGNRINSQDRILFDYSQRITICNNVVFMWAFVGGKELRFCLDTGAESNVVSSIAPKKALRCVSISGRIKVNDAGSQSSELLYGVINDFELGSRKIPDMKTIISNLYSLTKIYNMQIDGVLGYEFLKQGKIYINCKKSKIGICYNN